MNITLKFVILLIFIFLILVIFYLNISKSFNCSQNKYLNIQKGGQNNDCNLSEIIKHNTNENKWIYINGVIYDITSIIQLDNVVTPDIFKNISMTNVNTLINLLKYTDLQDLHIILKSYDNFNNFVNEYKSENENSEIQLEEFDYGVLDSDKDRIEQINKNFSNFKLLLLISLKQFKIGLICPSGLTI